MAKFILEKDERPAPSLSDAVKGLEENYARSCRDAALYLGMNPADPPVSLKHAIGMIKGPNELPQKQAIYATFAKYFERGIEALTLALTPCGGEGKTFTPDKSQAWAFCEVARCFDYGSYLKEAGVIERESPKGVAAIKLANEIAGEREGESFEFLFERGNEILKHLHSTPPSVLRDIVERLEALKKPVAGRLDDIDDAIARNAALDRAIAIVKECGGV